MCFTAVRAAEVAVDTKKIPAEEDYRKQSSIRNIAGDQIKKLKSEIKSLIVRKKQTKQKSQQNKIINKMVVLHEDLKKQTKIYNKQTQVLKYNFPARGERGKRKYLPMRVDTLDEIEQGVGIDSDLTRIRKKVEGKYAPFVPKKEFVEHKVKADNSEAKKKKSAREQIILEQ